MAQRFLGPVRSPYRWGIGCTLICVLAFAGRAEAYALLDFPSDGSVQAGSFKNWVLDSTTPRSLSLSFSIQSDFLAGVDGACEAVHSAIRSWDDVSPIIHFVEADYAPIVNSDENWAAGSYYFEGPGPAEGGVGIGANVDIFSRPGDFEFTYRGQSYGFGGTSLAYTVPIAFSGNIVSVDVYFNSDYEWSATGGHVDVETVALHEIGHALGLDHPDQAEANGAENYYPWSNKPGKEWSYADVMHSTYWPDGINRTLGRDEAGGLAFVYDLTQGDATLDGWVDISDLTAVSSHWEMPSDWTGGDFDGDGLVGITDLTIMAGNWSEGGVIPEPAVSVLLLAGGVSLLRRKADRGSR